MKQFLQSLVVACLSFAMVGCYEEPVGPEMPEVGSLTLSTETMEVSPNGGEYSVDIYSEYEYQTTTNADWIVLYGSTYRGSYYTLDFIVNYNDTGAPREGVITVFCEDYNLTATLTVVQAAGSGEWKRIGVGKFRGAGVLDNIFNIDTEVEVEVEIYEHTSKSGVYKVIDPWPATLAFGFGYSSIEEALSDGISTTHANLIVDASDPNAVIMEWQSMGIDLGYGDMEICTGYPNYFDAALGAGTLVDGHITFPAKTGILFYSAGINAALGQSETAILYGNTSGNVRISLPGAKPNCNVEIITAKFSEAFPEYASQYSDEEAFAYGIWGKDIANAKLLILDEFLVDSHIYEGLTMEQIIANYGVEISSDILNAINSENGYISAVSGLTPGTTYIIAIYAENIYGRNAIIEGKHTTSGTKPVDPNAQPCEISADLNKLSVYMPEYAASYPDTHNVSYLVVGKYIKEAKFLIASTSAVEGALAQGATLEELVAGYADPFAAEDIAEINEAGYINGYVNLQPNTSYTMIVWAKNKYGEATIVTDTHVTDALPEVDYKGELVIGDYYMACTMGAGTDSETTFENLFTVSPDGESVTDFIVSNIGANVGGINPQWLAKYDSAAGTLTLNGIEKGYEEYGNSFGVPYAYADQAQTMVLVFFSYATADSQSGSDPLVLKVDPWTKEIVGMQNEAFIAAIVDVESGQILQSFGYYAGPLTSIVPYTPAATASVKKASAKVPFSSVNLSRVHSKSIKPAKMANFANTSKKSGVKTVKYTTLSLPGGKLTRKAVVGSMQLKSDVVPFSSVKIAK